MWVNMANLPVGTEFIVNNGLWSGKIVEVDGKKHVHVNVTGRNIELKEDSEDGYILDISITEKG